MLTTGSSFSIHAVARDAATAAPQAQAAKSEFSFGDFLDIVNPLQHLPVVGTLYRAVTGDQIKTPEKLVGDALFGGLWGLLSSLADTAFQAATGKNFGDTVLALVTGERDAKPAPAPNPAPAAPGVAALTASLDRRGFDDGTAQRALAAYRRMNAPAFAD